MPIYQNPPYVGIQPQESSFHIIPEQVSSMLGRVFFPRSTALKATAYIQSNMGPLGFIGQDQRFEFAKHLKTPDGQPIPLKEKDFYVQTIVTPLLSDNPLIQKIEAILKKIFFFLQPKQEATIAYYYMPSSLFYGAKEKDKIRYFLDDQLIELTLQQQSHPLDQGKNQFEEFLDTLSCAVDCNEKTQDDPIYLFKEDVPDHVIPWETSLGYFNNIRFLTDSAVIYEPSTNTYSTATKDNLEPVAAVFADSSPFIRAQIELSLDIEEKKYYLILVLGGRGLIPENMRVLIDEHYLFVGGTRAPSDLLPDCDLKNSRFSPLEMKFEYVLPRTLEPPLENWQPTPFDPDSIKIKSLKANLVMLTIEGQLQ